MTTRKQLLLKRQHGEYSNKVILVFGNEDLTQLHSEIVERDADYNDEDWTEGDWYTILFQKVINS